MALQFVATLLFKIAAALHATVSVASTVPRLNSCTALLRIPVILTHSENTGNPVLALVTAKKLTPPPAERHVVLCTTWATDPRLQRA